MLGWLSFYPIFWPNSRCWVTGSEGIRWTAATGQAHHSLSCLRLNWQIFAATSHLPLSAANSSHITREYKKSCDEGIDISATNEIRIDKRIWRKTSDYFWIFITIHHSMWKKNSLDAWCFLFQVSSNSLSRQWAGNVAVGKILQEFHFRPFRVGCQN